jgi:hypothetical protein
MVLFSTGCGRPQDDDALGAPVDLGSSVTPMDRTSDGDPPGTATANLEPIAAGLHPGLRLAMEAAVDAAADDGHRLFVNSGFRTPAEQERLLVEAIAEYGSEREAMRWVFPPDRSMHVQGLAVDVGDGPAADWLEQHGAAFGLCRTLGWEWWHFEWRPAWEASATCPAPVDEPEDAPGVTG